MTTTIADIPFALLPIQTIAQLACMNNDFSKRGAQEIALRDIGSELYQYLLGMEDMQVLAILYQRLPECFMWAVITTVWHRVRQSSNHMTMFVPKSGPIMINQKCFGYNPSIECVTSSSNQIDFLSMFPHVLSGAEGITSSFHTLYTTLHDRIQTICKATLPILLAASGNVQNIWSTNALSFYGVNFRTKQVYTSNMFFLRSSHTFDDDRLPCQVIMSAVALSDVLYSLIMLRIPF